MLQQIVLHNFRNYSHKTFSFKQGINTISGPNGIGKTNLLEALYLLSTGRSFRTNHFQDLILHGESAFMIEAAFLKEGVSQSISFSFDGTSKRILLNETPIYSHSELLGILPSVLYAPNDIALISGAPSERRRFLNIHIAQFDKHYVHHLMRYTRAMKQRNALLKIKSNEGIDIWEAQMKTSASYLQKKRKDVVDRLSSRLLPLTRELASEEFEIVYHPSLLQLESKSRDYLLGTTSHGPHRDDLTFTLGAKDAKLFCSEGQKRTCITALRLAELEDINGIFCIDDFGMHLDQTRQKVLTDKLMELSQVLITVPNDLDTPGLGENVLLPYAQTNQ